MDELRQYIYALRCPVDNMVHYVGRTKYPAARLKQHVGATPDGTKDKQRWLNMLKEQRLEPELIILQMIVFEPLPREVGLDGYKLSHRFRSEEDPNEVERYWIMRLYQAGHPLAQRIPLENNGTPKVSIEEAQERGREFVASLER